MISICLVMIVKNEIKVLPRCFDSVHKYIDYWIICDTGSTDGTQDYIKNYFEEKSIPGELLQHEWKNFGYNRSLAVRSAYGKADYLLLMDADFVFIPKDEDFKKNKLDYDGYQIAYEGGLDYRQTLFVSGRRKWRYVGVTHEYITCDGPKKYGSFNGFTFYHFADGGNRSDKYERDVRLLTEGLKSEPNNVRYMFYLAQSHKDLGNYDEAIKYYKMRAEKGGWGEEVYYSLYQIGVCMINNDCQYDDFKDALLKAYNYRPSRLEALYYLIRFCRLNNKSIEGYEYGSKALNTPYPSNDMLFIDRNVHLWSFWDELALCAYHADRPEISLKIYKRIEKDIPHSQMKRYNANLKWFEMKYSQQKHNNKSENHNDNNITSENNKSENYNDNNITSENNESENNISGNKLDNNELENNKVAIFIVNYNMNERADKIIETLNKTVKHPHDIYLIDNGSNKMEPSKHTTIRLTKNVQTTNGWLMGLHYADAIETVQKFKYFAYCFIITSTELVEMEKDIIGTMVKTMKNDENVVGVHPSLTDDSTTWWTNMKNRESADKDQVYFIDNICSCYRASWFNKIGRFDANFTYAWGIDIETGYSAWKDKKKIILDHNIMVRKITNIGYTMDRMNMKATERHQNATKELTDVFTKKYGPNFREIVYGNRLRNAKPYTI